MTTEPNSPKNRRTDGNNEIPGHVQKLLSGVTNRFRSAVISAPATSSKLTQQSIVYANLTYDKLQKLTIIQCIHRHPEMSGFKIRFNA
jgi:hypothetical protein